MSVLLIVCAGSPLRYGVNRHQGVILPQAELRHQMLNG
jgi:hypothetical protein